MLVGKIPCQSCGCWPAWCTRPWQLDLNNLYWVWDGAVLGLCWGCTGAVLGLRWGCIRIVGGLLQSSCTASLSMHSKVALFYNIMPSSCCRAGNEPTLNQKSPTLNSGVKTHLHEFSFGVTHHTKLLLDGRTGSHAESKQPHAEFWWQDALPWT